MKLCRAAEPLSILTSDIDFLEITAKRNLLLQSMSCQLFLFAGIANILGQYSTNIPAEHKQACSQAISGTTIALFACTQDMCIDHCRIHVVLPQYSVNRRDSIGHLPDKLEPQPNLQESNARPPACPRFHQTIARLTTRRFGDMAPVREKGCLNCLFPSIEYATTSS